VFQVVDLFREPDRSVTKQTPRLDQKMHATPEHSEGGRKESLINPNIE